jgi:Ras GTPase-activating-like protein IQGAP2/3
VQEYFQGCSDDAVNSIVGGFFFLRYVNPAIVTLTPDIVPHAEMSPGHKHALVMVRLHVLRRRGSDVRRRAGQLGKVIQNLSNGLLFGDKEQFMTVLNPYMEAELPRVRQLFASLVDVEDLPEHYRVRRSCLLCSRVCR